MFERLVRFFAVNSRMNYTLFVLIFALGIYSYIKTPKEIFPIFDMDMISISGSYSGASLDMLDSMAVQKIEDDIKGIQGIDTINSVITPGKFTIILELKKGQNKYNISNKVKDAVALTTTTLPSDMDEPQVTVVERAKDLLKIVVSSKHSTLDEIKDYSENLKSKLQGIKDVSEVEVKGQSDKFYEVLLDDAKINALGLNKSDIFTAISTISYIFPIGTIEAEEHFYISTKNGKQNANEFYQTLLNIGESKVYLKDIAQISKKYEQASTLFSLNGNNSISLEIKQDSKGNAITLAADIAKFIDKEKIKNPNLEFEIINDESKNIRDRLDIVFSNITLGVLLITLLVSILINVRMAFIIIIGIPTSFVIGALCFYLLGFSINMISLIGVLLAIGIVVDDAIIISENIQRHIEEGMSVKEAAIVGTKEMGLPVFMASITTIFAFIPALMISGQMGEVMKLIPIALSILVLASLIESFLFLPIHASHTLNAEAKTLSWEKANKIYSDVIHFFMRYKKTFLIVFVILTPLLTVLLIQKSKFQMFPQFDTTYVSISIKLDKNTKVEESFEIVKKIEQDFLANKDRFFIKNTNSVAGYRKDSANNTENYPYAASITMELHDLAPSNFVDKYVTPYLSLFYSSEGRIRTKTSQKISNEIKEFLKSQKYKKRYDLVEISVVERKLGPIKADIEIGLVGNDSKKIMDSMHALENSLKNINGIKSIANTATLGIDEIKLEVNSYGEQLGVDETYLGNILSNYYLEKKKGVVFNQNDMLDIKISSLSKDNFEEFKNLQVPLKSGKVISLNQIVTFKTIQSFEKITKEEGDKNFYFYAIVDPKIITAAEVSSIIEPIIKEIQNNAIIVRQKGEAEKKAELKNDMLAASALAMLLIMLSLLYMFNSFRDTLIIMSIIPFSILGVLLGHQLMGLNLSMPSLIGALGLAGVVINDGIVMMEFLKKAKTLQDVFYRASLRFRPIILTTVTTLVGMTTLIFFPTGQAAIFQPIAVSLGFGLFWGTVLNLIYLPVLYTFLNRIK